MKWYLISAEDVDKIRAALEVQALLVEETGYAHDTARCRRARAEALYALATGLHTTDCVPDDFKEAL